jgi:hypothetical protein
MIIKFESRERWVVFGEVDHIEYEEIPSDSPMAVSADSLCYPPSDRMGGERCVLLSFFTKNMNAPTVAVAYSPIYLMNDQGRTVETI